MSRARSPFGNIWRSKIMLTLAREQYLMACSTSSFKIFDVASGREHGHGNEQNETRHGKSRRCSETRQVGSQCNETQGIGCQCKRRLSQHTSKNCLVDMWCILSDWTFCLEQALAVIKQSLGNARPSILGSTDVHKSQHQAVYSHTALRVDNNAS